MSDEIPVVYDRGGSPTTVVSQRRWWLDETNPGGAMVDEAKRIEESPHERGRRRACLTFARLHTGRPLASIYDYGSAFRTPYAPDPWGFGWKLPLNVVQAVIEAISAKLAKNKPRPLILTEGGDWALQRQAKGLTQYLDGLHRATGLYQIGRRIFRDGGTFGTGLFHLFEDRKKATIGIDRTLASEMIVDDIESARGKPQTEYRKTPVYRGVLMETFGAGKPEVAKLIESAKGYNPSGTDGRWSEMIPVYEGWKLGDMHAVGIAEGTLFKEEWEFDWFPSVRFHWRQADTGVWGLGAAENLLGLQYEINQMLSRFQANMKLGAKLWVFRPTQGGPQKAQMTNEAMTIIDADTPPVFATPNPMPAQAYTYLWDLYAKAFEIEGVSQLAATGVKPAGLDAAVAMREYNDIQTERFVLMGQDWEDVHLEIAEKEIALSKRMYKRTSKSITVHAPGAKFIQTIDFAKVNMEENRYTVGIFPTSSLPTTPAARMQTIKEWFESGLIPDRETALDLLDFPDLRNALSLELAAIEDIKRILEKLVDDGKYEPPEPYMNLDLALRMTQSAYLRARNDGVPEKRRDYLLRFIDEIRDLQEDMKPQAPAAAPAAPGPNPAALAPPPQPVDAAGVPTMTLPPGIASAAVPSTIPA